MCEGCGEMSAYERERDTTGPQQVNSVTPSLTVFPHFKSNVFLLHELEPDGQTQSNLDDIKLKL